jgi:hypothetical protein
MKKKLMICIAVICSILLLCTIPFRLKDGGTVKYQALLYSISDVHRISHVEEDGYEDGIIIEILGMEIYNKVEESD